MSEMLYPIGIQDFEKIRQGGYVYVDKTLHIHELVHTGVYYFLSRPRRFGKSLLLSTMEAYFRGQRELFKGLSMEQLEKDWTAYPVLHLDLNARKYDSESSLIAELNKHLEKWETLYGDDYKDRAVEERFYHIVEQVFQKTGQRVVILIDEYDKPLLQTINNESLQNKFRSQLKAFYSVLKTQDRYIRFAFLTGVTKFGKVSVFSDLNNLTDISMDKRYADICGMTEEEIHANFEPVLHELAKANGMTYEEACLKLKEEYDGYHFEINTPGIYNPFSLLNTLSRKTFKSYWFETGTPTFLVELLKRHHYRLGDLTRERVTEDTLNSVDAVAYNPIPMIYQSGYLTIDSYNPRFKKYVLAFPNHEVEEGFIRFLLPAYIPVRNKTDFDIEWFVEDVESGDADSFMTRLQGMFADISYQVVGDAELYFQNVLYVLFKLLGFYVDVERNTSHGRMDMVIQTQDYIYLIECKLDRSAQEALQQIEDKGYALPFVKDSRQLFKIGVNFSTQTRCIDGYEIRQAGKEK